MAGPSVQIDAARTQRGLVPAQPHKRGLQANPVLKFWRWLINSALRDARATLNGEPTDIALLNRQWIEEYKPAQSDRDAWASSLECACQWLGLDVDAERTRLLTLVDAAWDEAALRHLRERVYQRRAAVLTCAGVPTAIQRQFVLPLVSSADYDTVAGVEHGDPPARPRRPKRRHRPG